MRILRMCVACALLATPLTAQTREQIAAEPIVKIRPGDTPVPGECLSRQQLDLIDALNALRRPTVGVEADGDDPAPFNPQYFIGTWKVQGLLPDSPLGPGGDFAGTETVRQLDTCSYESSLQATVPGVSITIKALMVYDRRAGYLVRLEEDSRGFRLLKTGHVGGDPGGYSSHFWQTQPVTRERSVVRLKGRTLVSSPESFRVQMQISLDGDRFTNFGTLVWERSRAGGR